MICYLGPFYDHTGYGEANRHAILALDAAGVSVNASLVSYTRDVADYGKVTETLERLRKNVGEYRIKILHTTPDQYQRYYEPGKYHIGHFFWETTRVPQQFVEALNLMDEIWTGSEYNKEAIERSGVKKPVYVFPQAIQTDRGPAPKYQIADFDGFLFYSIFEWTDRKNPEALLQAFWEEFQNGENVGLLLKTFFKDFSKRSKDMIKDSVNRLKRSSGLKSFPPIFVYKELMDRHQVWRLHATGDCFVSAHRGEGWGVPQVEALLQAKPVITTNCGGVHEYLTEEHAKLLPWSAVKVTGMAHSSFWYTGDQLWADVSVESLRKAMRWVYENRQKAKDMAMRGSFFVKERFNLERVGQEMAARIDQIEEELNGRE